MYSSLPPVEEIDFANLREQVLSRFPAGKTEMNIWINRFQNKSTSISYFVKILFLDILGRVDFVV